VRQLERILAKPLFQTSKRLSTFLRFAVENALAGRAEQLKEYVIGVEVFERGASYSPQEDPIVRIIAERLRSKLAEYYQGDGHSRIASLANSAGWTTANWNALSRLQTASTPATGNLSKEQPAHHGVRGRIGVRDLNNDMARQVPDQVLTIDET
jgi:hypothetical protein